MITKSKKKPNKIQAMIAQLDRPTPPDCDEWVGEFFPLLQEKIEKSDSVEESVLSYFATQFIENQVSNGGFAQAYINFGIDSQWFEFAYNGYKFFKRDKSAQVLKEAMKLAQTEAKKIEAVKKSGLEAAVQNFKEGTFKKLDREFNQVMISWSDRPDLVKKYQADFEEL